jgi:hypothetical protein
MRATQTSPGIIHNKIVDKMKFGQTGDIPKLRKKSTFKGLKSLKNTIIERKQSYCRGNGLHLGQPDGKNLIEILFGIP